ncbi:MAG: hypothetical protein OXN80_05375 [bacterium]|nr:hypothetical protein [bacterium]
MESTKRRDLMGLQGRWVRVRVVRGLAVAALSAAAPAAALPGAVAKAKGTPRRRPQPLGRRRLLAQKGPFKSSD